MNIAQLGQKTIATHEQKNINVFDGWLKECPGNYYNVNQSTDIFDEHIYMIIQHFFVGGYLQFNAHYSQYFFGLSLGFLLAAFKNQKYILTKQLDENVSAKNFKKLKVYYISWLFVSPIIILINWLFINLQVTNQIQKGIRSQKYNFIEYFSSSEPLECIIPELQVFLQFIQMLSISIFIIIFETGLNSISNKKAERILYIRRYSTLWLTHLVLGYSFSAPLRNILQVTSDVKFTAYEFVIYICLYFSQLFLLQCVLDTYLDCFSLDWVILKYRHIFQISSKFNPISDQHLKIQPVNLFGLPNDDQ
ncbi:Transmembrane_domain-containing protein [Hexamita inflata]|uniref:Transmembrane_domain-containing protein n=1 Tax=Hexamita inflata TaxID=28002 RepID=A0ABP1M3D1_9EUKA